MCENDDRCVGAKTFYVCFEPFELLVTELAEPAGLEVKHIDQPNEMDAVLVKAVPA